MSTPAPDPDSLFGSRNDYAIWSLLLCPLGWLCYQAGLPFANLGFVCYLVAFLLACMGLLVCLARGGACAPAVVIGGLWSLIALFR